METNRSECEAKLGFLQIEDSFEEGDVMDWYEDDEMRRQWEEVSKEEEKIVRRRT